jgi:hypothetical protein
MLRFIMLFVLGTASAVSFAASSEGHSPVEDPRRITAEYIRTVATDYIILSTGYVEALQTTEIQAAIRSKLSSKMLAESGDRIGMALAAFGGGILHDVHRWNEIAIACAAWIESLSTGVSVEAPANLLNAILHFRLVQAEDYAILKHQETKPDTLSTKLPFNETLQKGQLDDLKDIWEKVFPYANPLYQHHYSESNPRYTGKGQHEYAIYDEGHQSVRDLFDPTVRYGIRVTVAQRSEKSRTAGQPVEAQITSRTGVTLTIPKSILKAEALPKATLEHYESGAIEFGGHMVTLDAQTVVFTFPDSGFRVELSRLSPALASDMIELFNLKLSEMTDSRAISIKQKKKPATAAAVPTAVDPETEYRNSLSLDQLMEYFDTGKRPDAASAEVPKPKKGKKTKARASAASAAGATAADVLESAPTDAAIASAAASAGAITATRSPLPMGGSASSAAASAGAITATRSPLPMGGSASSADARAQHNKITLALAARMGTGLPLPERTYAMRPMALNTDDKAMLANLISSSKTYDGFTAKAVNTYKWADLVKLMNHLGFTQSSDLTIFTYDKTRRIRLHYIHSTGHHLYNQLISTWRDQMTNIGFDQAYLESLLG